MGSTIPRENDHFVDLESGGITSEEEGLRENDIIQVKRVFGRVCSEYVNSDGHFKGEDVVKSQDNLFNSRKIMDGRMELLTEKRLGLEEKVGHVEENGEMEKLKKKSSKKPPKPPRPPKPPMLDAADQKLIREISELAMLKRARIERVKALKKMKAAKAASSSSNTCAMVITLIFCLIIILQGAFSRGRSNVHFQGSPLSAVDMSGGLISVQYYRNATTGSTSAPVSGSPT